MEIDVAVMKFEVNQESDEDAEGVCRKMGDRRHFGESYKSQAR